QTPTPRRRMTWRPSGRRNVSIDGRLYRTTRLVSLSSVAIASTVAGPLSASRRRVIEACLLSSGTATAMAGKSKPPGRETIWRDVSVDRFHPHRERARAAHRAPGHRRVPSKRGAGRRPDSRAPRGDRNGEHPPLGLFRPHDRVGSPARLPRIVVVERLDMDRARDLRPDRPCAEPLRRTDDRPHRRHARPRGDGAPPEPLPPVGPRRERSGRSAPDPLSDVVQAVVLTIRAMRFARVSGLFAVTRALLYALPRT